MKNLRYCVVCLVFLIGAASHVHAVNRDEIFANQGAKLDVFHTGRALMIGETLTSPAKVSPHASAPPPLLPAPMTPSDVGRTLMQVSQREGYSPKDFGIDISKITPRVADAKLDKIFANQGAKLDVFRTGRALMIGETLTSPAKVSPHASALPPLLPAPMTPSDVGRILMQVSQWQGYSAQDFGIDMSKITPRVTDAKLSQDVTMTVAKMGFRLVGGPAAMGVTAFTLLNVFWDLHDIKKAGTGQVDFTILRNIAPSMVMGAEALRGPENNRWSGKTDNFNITFGDSYLKTNLTGTKVTEKITTSSAPGYIGKYGYDPNTDTIMTRTRMNYTERVETGGNRVNPNNFLNNSYSPPPVMHTPSYTMPMPVYSPPPRISMPSFSPPPGRWR